MSLLCPQIHLIWKEKTFPGSVETSQKALEYHTKVQAVTALDDDAPANSG